MALNQPLRIKFAEEVFGISEMDTVIIEEGYKEGKTVYTVRPIQSPQEKLIKTQIEEGGKLYYKAEQSKQKTEFERYKQDCRKRALDLAYSEIEAWYRAKPAGAAVNPDPKPDIEKTADKYYEWLISIPETK